MSDTGELWRDKPLNEVADAAIENTMQSHIRAGIELQRRLIAASAKASSRLLVATWVIAGLTVVLIGITILQLTGAVD